jgi:tRNA-2-methylthio-N6-dimethylallyladenosine synthase
MHFLPVLPASGSGPKLAGSSPAAAFAGGERTLGADELLDETREPALEELVPFEKRLHLEVFGCQMNKLDAEILLGTLLDEGYRIAPSAREAGVILFYTCAIREHAESRVFSKLGQLRALKRRRPELVIGVLGCSAQNHQRAILRRYPQVGIVCGPGEFLRMPELILEARRRGQVAALDLEAPVTFARTRNLGPNPYQAYVSVMRGCDQICSYCVVPRTRGREVSRPVREIVDEVRALVEGGVREVTLLGQTVNSYGKRLAPRRSIGLQHVLHELDKIAGLERIRFITSHPRFMNPELIDAMGRLEKVCESLHLPVQSGSDAVLRRMIRSYSMAHYRKVVAALRERVPGLALATDIIVGFSGESEAEFQETVRLMEEMRYHSVFVFKYSERPGTSAASMADDVPEEVKRERNQILLALQKRIALEIHRSLLGTVVEVLVEGRSKQDASRWCGRDRAFHIVVFPAGAGEDLVGKLVPVRLTGATPLTLIGERAGEGR